MIRTAPGPGFVLILLLLCAAPVSAQDTHLVVITGVGGDEEHTKTFHKWATMIPDANIIYLSEKPDLDPSLIKARSTRENVQKTLTDLAARARPGDAVLIVLIGHGSFNGQQAAFNLPGPDLTPAEYGRLLAGFAAERVAFVNTAASSGAFIPAVAGPGRAIVTATKTGGERNETRFPEYFVQAFTDESADRDRNGRVSIAEAFEYAKARVVRTFEQEGLLLSEHATLEDGVNGSLASALFLAPAQAAAKVDTSDPEVRALVEERDAIERQIAALRLMKPSMDAAQYDAQMEKLLTQLALKTKAIRERQGRKDRQ